MDLLLDEQKVIRDAVEVMVDNFGVDKDLGMTGSGAFGGGAATPYASTPFAQSPMMSSGGEMSPFVDGNGSFSPAVGGAFSPAYSPASGSYGSGFASGSYGSSFADGSSSPVYSPTSPGKRLWIRLATNFFVVVFSRRHIFHYP
jgi:hypothetical protein